jgi:hypothetical protein
MLKAVWGRFFGGPDDTFEERIRKNHGISEKFTVNVLMSVAAYYSLGINEYVSKDKSFLENLNSLASFLQNNYLPFALAVFTLVWFALYRNAVRSEMEILFRLFSQINPPQNWQDLVGIKQVPILAIAIPATFLALAASVKLVPLYCIILIGLNFMDIRGNSILRQLITTMFLDSRLAPPKDDPASEFITRRRAVAEEYWVACPQVERIGLMMIANGIALVIASGASDKIIGVELWPGLAHIIIIAAVVINEVVIFGWRDARDCKLAAIKSDFEAFTRGRQPG